LCWHRGQFIYDSDNTLAVNHACESPCASVVRALPARYPRAIQIDEAGTAQARKHVSLIPPGWNLNSSNARSLPSESGLRYRWNRCSELTRPFSAAQAERVGLSVHGAA